MSHRNLAPVALASLQRSLEAIFEDEAVRSSPRLVELASNARYFLGQTQTEMEGLVNEYDAFKTRLHPLADDERA